MRRKITDNAIKFIIISVLYVVLISCKKNVFETENPGKLRLVQLCDPQLGFGNDGFDNDVVNLEMAIRQINEIAPDVVLFPGDVVHRNDDKSISTFLEIVSHINAPILLAPGNHELSNPITLAKLERYRNYFGEDFKSIEYNGYCIISANSQYWHGEAPEEEATLHDTFIKKTFQTAKNKSRPVVMLTHIPPFVSSVDEEDGYYNLPKTKRKEILDLCEANGTIIWLAGHTHTTGQRNYGAITILNGETTSANFDDRPLGFRLLTIFSDKSFEWEFIPLNSNSLLSAPACGIQ